MPSSPESGPTRMSASSCSIRRRVSSIALSAVSSAQPYPTISIFLPPTVAPVMPSLGFLLAGLAPALSISAWLKPEAVGSKNEPNAPSQSDRNPTLIVPPPPDWALDPPLSPSPSSSSSPQAVTRPRASKAPISASNVLTLTATLLLLVCRARLPPRSVGRVRGRHGARRPPSSRAEQLAAALPQAHEPAGRDQHDHEEDDPEDRVEALRSQNVADSRRPLARVVVEQRVGERSDPRALQPVEPPDDRDDQDVDRLRQVDRTRRDAAVVPDRQHAGEGRHEGGESEREDAVARDVE